MFRNYVAVAVAACALVACSEPDQALKVTITLETEDGREVLADRLRIDVLAGQSADAGIENATFARPSDDVAVVVIRRTAAMPQQVYLRVDGLLGACDDDGLGCLAARSAVTSATFPEQGVTELTIALRPPGTDLDFDRDGYIATPLGSDCNDDDISIHPGRAELCTSGVDNNCDGFAGCDDTGCFTAAFCANPPTQLALVGATGGLEDGGVREQQSYSCIALTYELRNAAGQPRTAVRNTPVRFSGDNLNAYASGCTLSPINGNVIPLNQTQLQVWARADTAVLGNGTLHLEADVYANGPVVTTAVTDTVIPLRPTPVTALTFLNPVETVAGICSEPLEVVLRSSMERPTLADVGGLTVELQVPSSVDGGANAPSGNLLFLNAQCEGNGANEHTVTFAPGEGRAQVWVMNTRAKSYFVDATAVDAGSIASARGMATVAPAATAALVFDPPNLNTTTDVVCSGLASLYFEDAFSNRRGAPEGLQISLSKEPHLQELSFKDTECQVLSANPVLPVPPGAMSFSFAVESPNADGGIITANAVGHTLTPAELRVVFNAGTPDHLWLSENNLTSTAGLCGPPFLLTVHDANHNATPAIVPITARLDAGPDISVHLSTTNCLGGGGNEITVPTGSSSVFVRSYTELAPQTFAVQIDAIVDGGVSVLSSEATVTNHRVSPGSPALLAFAGTTSHSTRAGDFTAGVYQVQVRDQFNNARPPQGGLEVQISASALNVGFAIDGGQTSSVIFISASNDAGTVPFTATATTTGDYTLTATPVSSPIMPANGATLNVTPHDPIPHLTGGGTVVAGTCAPVTLTLLDRHNNPVPVGMSTAFPLTTLPTTTAHAGNCDAGAVTEVTINAGHTAGFNVRPIQAVAQTVTISGTDASVAFTVEAGPLHHIDFDGGSASLEAGQCSAPLLLVRRDVFNNPVTTGPSLMLSQSGLTGFSFSTQPGCSPPTATADVTFTGADATMYYLGTASGTGTLSTPVIGSFPVTITPSSPSNIVLSANSTVVAGDCTNVTANLFDRFGNSSTAPAELTLNLTHDGGVQVDGGTAIFSPGTSCVGSDPIVFAAASDVTEFSLRTVRAGQLFVSADAGLDGGPGTHEWTVTPGPATHIEWLDAGAVELTRFACNQLGVLVAQDQYNNQAPVASERSVALGITGDSLGLVLYDGGCAAPLTDAGAYLASGTSTVTVFAAATGTHAGGGTVSIQEDGSSVPHKQVTITGGTGALAVAPGVTHVEPGACQPIHIQRTNDLGAPLALGSTPFTLTMSVADGGVPVTLYTDPFCSSPMSVPGAGTITPPLTEAVVYARAPSTAVVNEVTLVAADSFGTSDAGEGLIRTYPLVRQGRCDLDEMQASRICALEPPLPFADISRSFVTFSSTGGNTTAQSTNVRCFLHANDGGAVECQRGAIGPEVLINYDVASFGLPYADGGVTVSHHVGSGTSLAVPSAPMDKSFVLFSSRGPHTGDNNEAAFATATLTNTTQVDLTVPDGGSTTYALQVVRFAGATVARGEVEIPKNENEAVDVQMSALAQSFLLYSVRAPDNGTLCHRAVKGSIDGNQLLFERGDAGVECQGEAATVVWELIGLPAGNTTAMKSLSLSGNDTTFTSFDMNAGQLRHRSLAFSGGQGPGGQSMGSTNYSGAPWTSTFHGLITLNENGTVTVERTLPPVASTSSWGVWHVIFDP